jgi:hypothetical protein
MVCFFGKAFLKSDTAVALRRSLSSYVLNPANGIDMTTASESAGRQIQNNRNLIIKIPQT